MKEYLTGDRLYFAVTAVVIAVAVWLWRGECVPIFDDTQYEREYVTEHPGLYDGSHAGERISSWEQVGRSIYFHHLGHNDRMANDLCYVLAMFPRGVVRGFSVLMVLGLCLLPPLVVLGRRGLGRPWIVGASLLLTCGAFPWGEHMSSLNHMCNYPFAAVFTLLALLVWQRREVSMLIGVPLTLIAGGMHEAFGLSLLGWMVATVVVERDFSVRRRWLVGSALVGFLVTLWPARLGYVLVGRDSVGISLRSLLTAIRLRLPLLFLVLALLRRRKEMIPYVVAVLLNIGLCIVSNAPTRGLWPAGLFALLGVLKMMGRIEIKRGWSIGLGYAATVLFAVFAVHIIRWQGIVAEDYYGVNPQLASAEGPVAYDLNRRGIPPMTTLGIPEYDRYTDYVNARCEGTVANGRIAAVIPTDWVGRRFEEWDKLPGNTGLRTRAGYPLYTLQPDEPDNIELVFGEQLASALPENRLSALLRPERRDMVQLLGPFYVGRWEGDSLWMYLPWVTQRHLKDRYIEEGWRR